MSTSASRKSKGLTESHGDDDFLHGKGRQTELEAEAKSIRTQKIDERAERKANRPVRVNLQISIRHYTLTSLQHNFSSGEASRKSRGHSEAQNGHQADTGKVRRSTMFFAQRAKAPDFVVHRHIMHEFQKTIDRLAQSMDGESEVEGWGLESPAHLYKEAAKFEKRLSKTTDAVDPDSKRLWRYLRQAYNEGGFKGLGHELKYRFSSFVMGSGFTSADINNQRRLADLRFPIEWYPATRAIQRKIHLHVGPTNSGKTYQALRRLETAKSGLYAGPLRLLAHEVYSRLNAKGKKCALVTGEERRYPADYDSLGNTQMISCTVEMIPVNVDVDVAVIDEIQLLGDDERGWAWTQAFLGVKAKEVHLCGELRTVPLIEDLCRAMGEELIVHKYERLSPLQAMDKSLSSLKQLEKGDCVIVFSRVGIHAMKKDIEAATGKRCAVVYGSLPPETRAQQAALFNDPDNEYDYLCASDAVGMGLNLSIKRVVFEATSKHDGISHRTISVPQIKQIGGRAGRFRSAADATKLPAVESPGSLLDVEQKKTGTVGLVTTLAAYDLPIVKRALNTEPEPLTSAGIFPPNHVIARFASYFPPDTSFSFILLRLHEISTTHPRFHLCRFKDQLAIADCIQPYNLTITDKLTFIAAPINFRDGGMIDVCKAFARCLSEQSGGELLDIPEVKLELLDEDGKGKEYLKSLEALHKQITLYLWLSYRFAGVFRSQALAFHVKEILEKKIDASLDEVDFSENKKKQYDEMKRRAAKMSEHEIEAVDNVTDTPVALPLDWEAGVQSEPILNLPEDVERNKESKSKA